MALDPKLQKFTTAQQSIITYDYVDIANGTGVEVFYLMNTNTGASDDYLLSPNIIYSNDIYTSGTTNQEGSDAKTIDVDFDTVLNLPRDIKGDVKVSIPMAILGAGTSSHTYAIIKVRHWDGTTETDLGSGQTETFGVSGVGTRTSELKVISIPVSLTHFAEGDTLRITVEMWGQRGPDGGAAMTSYFAHDPKGRASATIFAVGITTTEVHIPFLIT